MTKAKTDQPKRFVEAAQVAECDDDPAAFERVFAKVVPPKKGKAKPDSKKPSH